MSLQFEDVGAAALEMAPVLLSQWLGGKRQGHEWVGERKANGGPGDSWSVNLNTGAWGAFATGEAGGDLVSLYAALNHLDQLAALKAVADMVGVTEGPSAYVLSRVAPPKPPESKPEPIPDDAPPIERHPKHGAPSAVYAYGSAFRVCRYDLPEGKVFSQHTWRDGKWIGKGYPAPRPAFNVAALAAQPDAPVIIVEGEKCAEVAAHMLKKYVAMTWAGGSQAVRQADWSVLTGRDVIIWPDADDPGKAAAAWLAAHLTNIAERVRVVQPNGQPPGWDIADAMAEGMDAKAIAKWAGEHIRTIEAPTPAAVSLPPTEPTRVGLGVATLEPVSQTLLPASERVRDGDYPAEQAPQSALMMWQSMPLAKDSKQIPHSTLSNASVILRFHPAFAGKIWLDTFRDKIYHTLTGAARIWSDADSRRVTAFIQQSLQLPKFNTMHVNEAAQHAAECNQHNSVVEWLDSLEWDGIPRLDEWLADSLGVERNEYNRAVSNNWPISMVARAFKPGCQVDTMPVLEGYMGRGKSTFLEILGGEWYKTLPMAFGDKDFLQAMQGAWLIEIPDMTGFSRREHTQVISTISTRTDEYRKSYGRHTEAHQRVAVFAATSETDDYINDTRGRRRYWPLRCKSIDLDVLRAQREQVFAEAVMKYRAGASWHIMPESADAEQLDRAPDDLWSNTVLNYAEHLWVSNIAVTSHRILLDAIDMKLALQTDSEKRRVAKIMRENGWIQVRDHTGRRWKKVER